MEPVKKVRVGAVEVAVWENEIKAKCGITDLVFSTEDLPLKHKAEEEIKGKKIVVYAEQV